MGMAKRVMTRSAMSMVRTILECGDIGVGGSACPSMTERCIER